ncbi:Protein asteroid [Melipona quadrifasciata]|uniref:Protein asteroid n=1 Tax=Melipona quadrifasciata TaxID=166423 RepID=A0A0M8ZRL7_9HYME|nr:Protein asteroid [Melipona quadrifasciata]
MGIPGLTAFINNHSDIYLEYYELHNTYLIIDGNNICYSIYNLYTKSNCAFGGDYDNYAQCVTNFFNDLLKCNVIPLVILDGGIEDKKLRTIIKRTRDRISAACSFCPLSQRKAKSIPLLLKEIFRDVMKENNIRHVQCLFEADNDIASVAKILKCPMLSSDSDFYIYGALYIPFDTLDTYVVKNPNGNGYMKCCKIYKVKNLLKSFKGLNQETLSLAAVLLGNDYVQCKTFKNFFRHLKLRGASNKKQNHRQCCIKTTLIWLSKHTLNNAIIEVLSRLIKPIRQKILDLIEDNINSYINISTEILVPLGLNSYLSANRYYLNKRFKFNRDINTLTYIEENNEEEEEQEQEEDDEIEATHTLNEFKLTSKNAAVNNLPLWFKNEILMSKYPSYFVDLIVRHLYICPVQVEDHHYPSSIITSLKILSVIFGILISTTDDRVCYMKYLVRYQNKKMMWCTLEATKMCKLPSLFHLNQSPLHIQKDIINDTLGIRNTDCMNELPPEWMLYVGCIKYWIHQKECSTFHKCYLYSIFISMLFNIIDSKIGRHRNMHIFQNKYCQIIETIKQKRKNDNYSSYYTMDGTIIEAYNEIDHHDCVLAAPFFISHFKINEELYTNPKIFDRYTVHVFAEFQSCVRHVMNLNALLRYPYSQIKIANLFNGTLLYNLSNNFKTRPNIEKYINTILQTSPSLLRLFHIFLLKVKPMFLYVFQDGISPHRKHKKRNKRSRSNKNNSATSDSEYFSTDDNLHDPYYYDVNNRFSVLNLV